MWTQIKVQASDQRLVDKMNNLDFKESNSEQTEAAASDFIYSGDKENQTGYKVVKSLLDFWV